MSASLILGSDRVHILPRPADAHAISPGPQPGAILQWKRFRWLRWGPGQDSRAQGRRAGAALGGGLGSPQPGWNSEAAPTGPWLPLPLARWVLEKLIRGSIPATPRAGLATLGQGEAGRISAAHGPAQQSPSHKLLKLWKRTETEEIEDTERKTKKMHTDAHAHTELPTP